jgi:lipopolysaccharide heptosyltransferase II
MILIKYIKNFFILAAVFLSALFFYVFFYFKKTFLKKRQVKRILIIDNAKIGDVVCATPVFRAIKEKYPDSYLAVLAIPRVEEILNNNKRINELIIAPLNSGLGFKKTLALFKRIKSKNFDVSVNLVPGTLNFILPFFAGIPIRLTSVNGKMGFFYQVLSFLASQRLFYQENELSIKQYLNLLKFLSIENNNLAKEVFIDALSEKKAEEFLASRGIVDGEIIVGLCLGAGNKIKEWGVNNFTELAKEIKQRYGFKVVVIGGPADEGLLKEFEKSTGNDAIIIYQNFSLKELSALIKRFDYFISVDTGPLFIANALGVPVIDIIGPFNYVEQAPYYDEKCEIVKPENIACWPCLHVYSSNVLKCRFGHYQCLNEITPVMVLSALEKLRARLT